jgi:hypothetical protein
MSTSDKKIAANRLNGPKSQGPRDTTSTRFNAIKHGLLSAGVTELDDAEGYRTMLRELIEEKKPVGPIEMFLVEAAALDMVKWRRARRLDGEYITSALNPPIREAGLMDLLPLGEAAIVDPGLPAAMNFESVQQLVIYQRYESAFTSRLFRTLHELERLQRMRHGERVPAPAAVDVNVDAGTKAVDSLTG